MMSEKYIFQEDRFEIIDPTLDLLYQEELPIAYLPKTPADRLHPGYVMREDFASNELYLEKEEQRDGQCYRMHQTGAVKIEMFYSQGQLHGPVTVFDEERNILAKSWFIRGLQEGKCVWHDPSGKLVSLQRYRHGVWHGDQEFYYPDGSPKTMMHYVSGHLEFYQTFC